MSWAQDEWKNNLPHVAVQKINAMEKNIEQLQKDQQQKKFKIESLEASNEHQRKKTDQEKAEAANLKKEIHGLEEQIRSISVSHDKVLHELSTKDNRISCLDGQLSKMKSSLDKENNSVAKLKMELERAVASQNKNLELLEQKDQDIAKLSKRLKLSSSDDVFNAAPANKNNSSSEQSQ
uniref:Centromere protein Cenp-F N-terminal domain-containing protein n=2 Tax=Clytia hemisphaerica TaxID=252671 RepID=A0A7M6DN61_9CNID